MTTECEQLLKRFLVLVPSKRADLVEIMSHPWINLGYEEDLLVPHQPPPDNVQKRK